MADNGTLTKTDIASAISNKVGLQVGDSQGFVREIIEIIGGALESGQNVKIPHFGTFILREKGRRMGRNPKNMDLFEIEPRRVLTFRPSRTLRDKVR